MSGDDETQACRWEGCDAVLCNDKVPVMRAHLKDHVMVPGYLDPTKVVCLWDECGQEMKYKSLPKHISNTHLQADHSQCAICGRWLSTSDAYKRHFQDNCRMKQPESG